MQFTHVCAYAHKIYTHIYVYTQHTLARTHTHTQAHTHKHTHYVSHTHTHTHTHQTPSPPPPFGGARLLLASSEAIDFGMGSLWSVSTCARSCAWERPTIMSRVGSVAGRGVKGVYGSTKYFLPLARLARDDGAAPTWPSDLVVGYDLPYDAPTFTPLPSISPASGAPVASSACVASISSPMILKRKDQPTPAEVHRSDSQQMRDAPRERA